MNKSKHKPAIITAVLGLPLRQEANNSYSFLLTRRNAPHSPKFHNKWQLAGGALEFGEKPEETLVREMKEELGVTPKILHPQPIVNTSVWIGGDDDTSHDVQIILISYIVGIGSQQPSLDHDPHKETNKFGWFSLQLALQLDFLPNSKSIVTTAHKLATSGIIKP